MASFIKIPRLSAEISC